MTILRRRQTAVLSAAAFALSCMPSHAGPCSGEIDRAQAQVDAKIAARAQSGSNAVEGSGALLHRQPTPGSMATAEQNLGEGAGLQGALAALDRAREADRANDKPACERALADAARSVGP